MSLPYMTIVTQPRRYCRFRYACETTNSGTIFADKTSGYAKKWPSCAVHNYEGRVKVVCSLVTADKLPKVHPHDLVGQYCSDGIGTYHFTITPLSNIMEFPNMGIRRVRVTNFRSSIAHRILELKVNPYDVVYPDIDDAEDCVNAGEVCLCFQTYLLDGDNKIFGEMKPVHSHVITNSKKLLRTTLKIVAVDKDRGSSLGGETIFLLCDRVSKTDIDVLFRDGNWVDQAEFHSDHVHQETAIVFKTPKYFDTSITEKRKVQMRLYRPSDGQESEPFHYYYLPQKCNRLRNGATEGLKKRKLADNSPPTLSSSSDDDVYDPFTMMTSSPESHVIEHNTIESNSKLEEIQQSINPQQREPANMDDLDNNDDDVMETNDDVSSTRKLPTVDSPSQVPHNGGSPISEEVTTTSAEDDSSSNSPFSASGNSPDDCSSAVLIAAKCANDCSTSALNKACDYSTFSFNDNVGDSSRSALGLNTLNLTDECNSAANYAKDCRTSAMNAANNIGDCSSSSALNTANDSSPLWTDEQCMVWLEAQDGAADGCGNDEDRGAAADVNMMSIQDGDHDDDFFFDEGM